MTYLEPTERVTAIMEIQRRAGDAFFARDPYAKFLPLLLCPPVLDWTRARSCDPLSPRRIIITAYGRNWLEREGWRRYATICAFSLLCDCASGDYGIDVVVQQTPAEETILEGFFPPGESFDALNLQERKARVVSSTLSFVNANTLEIAGCSPEINIRIDADCGVFPGTLGSCFRWTSNLGESGLNYRHSRRDALDQLFHPVEGRTRRWETVGTLCPETFLDRIAATVRDSLGVPCCTEALKRRLAARHWPSEGFSYIKNSVLPAYRQFRDAVWGAALAPRWDDEFLKVMLACGLDLEIEAAKVPIFEHPEVLEGGVTSGVVNFRNVGTISDLNCLSVWSPSAVEKRFGHVRRFVEALCRN
jgi:hypothetical protein